MCSKTRNWVRILMTAMSYYRSVFACGSKLFWDSQQLHKRALKWMVTPMGAESCSCDGGTLSLYTMSNLSNSPFLLMPGVWKRILLKFHPYHSVSLEISQYRTSRTGHRWQWHFKRIPKATWYSTDPTNLYCHNAFDDVILALIRI